MVSAERVSEDEIDLRELARSIFRHKLLLIVLPVVFALATWVYFNFLVPRPYEASASLLVTKPTLITKFDDRLQNQPQMADTQTLAGLATSTDVLQEVADSPELAGQFPQPPTPESLRGQLEVTWPAAGQMRLAVLDSDAERAAAVANVWAVKVAARLNSLYSTSETSLESIEQQINEARDNWTKVEAELLSALPENQVEALQVRVESSKDTLLATLNKIRDLDLIASDARSLSNRLQGLDGTAPLAAEDRLSLMLLHQRASSGSPTTSSDTTSQDRSLQVQTQLQVLTPDLTAAGGTVAEARQSLQAFQEAIQSQRQELQQASDEQQAALTRLSVDLEAATSRHDQLAAQRDAAKAAYEALSNRAQEARISLGQNDQAFKLGERAQPPKNPQAPRTLFNALLAALSGLILAVMLAAVIEWWRAPVRRSAA